MSIGLQHQLVPEIDDSSHTHDDVASERLKASSPRGHYVRLLIPTQQHTTQGQVHCGIEALEELERLIHAKELVALLDKRPQGLTATQNSAKVSTWASRI